MRDPEIEVVARSGYRGEEKPAAFFLFGERIEVVEILGAWIEETSEGRERKRFFRVRGSDGYVHALYYDEERGGWFMRG